MNPVIVTGAPYSGTSIVARLLQENLGVMMDEGPIKTDRFKPLGYYEDHKIIDINHIAYDYRLNNKNGLVPGKWAVAFTQWLTYRDNKYDKWGWKDPVCGGLFRHMHQFLKDPIWIVCKRKDKQVIKSLIKKGEFPKDIAVKAVEAFNVLVKDQLNGRCYYIDLSRHKKEDDIIAKLSGII